MDTVQKYCSRGDRCVHPDGSWLPATPDYFNKCSSRKDGMQPKCKACQSALHYAKHDHNLARNRAYWDEHKDEINRKDREQYATDEEIREKVRESHRKFKEKNPSYGSDYFRREMEQHPERVRERKRLSRARSMEHYRQQERDYRNSNRERINQRRRDRGVTDEDYRQRRKPSPEKRRAYKNNRRARVLNASGRLTAADLRIMLKTQRGRCWYCGAIFQDSHYHADHRIPLSRGGSNDPSNIVLACPTCNLSKGTKLPHEWSDRLL